MSGKTPPGDVVGREECDVTRRQLSVFEVEIRLRKLDSAVIDARARTLAVTQSARDSKLRVVVHDRLRRLPENREWLQVAIATGFPISLSLKSEDLKRRDGAR